MNPRGLLAVVALLCVSSCGDHSDPPLDIPTWAKVAPEQIAEAAKHDVPVAFENDLGMRFVLIPAGTFLMGSPEDEVGRPTAEEVARRTDLFDESQHSVKIQGPFYMQTTETTNAQYRHHDPTHESGRCDGYRLDGDTQPAVLVSLHQARSFADSLSRRDEERGYRLPTEVEYEYACRAGTVTAYSWGAETGVGWKYANAVDPQVLSVVPIAPEAAEALGSRPIGWPRHDGYIVTAPVGSYPPNGWGLFDMHGNAWELTVPPNTSYPGAETKQYADSWGRRGIALRGGSFSTPPACVRSAHRWLGPSDVSTEDIGFRLVSPLSEEEAE